MFKYTVDVCDWHLSTDGNLFLVDVQRTKKQQPECHKRKHSSQ